MCRVLLYCWGLFVTAVLLVSGAPPPEWGHGHHGNVHPQGSPRARPGHSVLRILNYNMDRIQEIARGTGPTNAFNRWRHESMSPGPDLDHGTGSDDMDDVMSARRYQLGKRFKLHSRKLNKSNLTYKISRYSTKIPRDQVDDVIARGFSAWASHSRLRFMKVTSGSADIDIRFVRGEHGDKMAFDGPGGYLAHSLFPGDGAAVHLDDEENFSPYGGRGGISLYQVFLHELGHALGLEHSKVRDAVMSPYYTGYKRDFDLTSDDIAAIQALYGKP